MAEAIGFASSIIAVVGLAGQVIQGCQNIKAWVGDFESAPKYVQDLIRELSSIEKTAKITDMLEKNIGREVDLQLAPALRERLDAVQEVRESITDAETVFQGQGHSRMSKGWQRLKVVLGKQTIQASVDKLSRAREQLAVVQLNVSLYLSQCHQEQLRGINELLSLGLPASQNSASAIDRINGTIQGIHLQTEGTATAVASLSSDVRRYFEEPRQHSNIPEMVASFQRMETLLREYTNQASNTHKERTKTEPFQCISRSIAEHDTPGQELNLAHLASHYHTKREFLCRTPFLTVSKTVSTANTQLEEIEEADRVEKTSEADNSYRYITTLDILMDLGFWRRGLKAVMGRSRRPYVSDLDIRLSTFHIIDSKAPIFQAAFSFDIETVRTLFTSGSASPFDQDTWGRSLFDLVFLRLWSNYKRKKATRGLELLKFLINCGGKPISLSNRFAWIILAMRESYPRETQKIVAEAVRLMFQTISQDPIPNWDVGTYITLTTQQSPVGEAVMQQSQWPLELRPTVRAKLRGVSTIVENDRQILEDEEGLLIAPLLIEAEEYSAFCPNGQELIRWTAPPTGIHSILHLYHESKFKKGIYTGCRNRITILLKSGSDPRAVTDCPFNYGGSCSLYCSLFPEMSVTQYALFTNTLDLWQGALENLGWSKADIEGLLDEEKYLGVPELFLGELEFRTQAENREEFLQIIATGGYGKPNLKFTKNLSLCLGMTCWDVSDTIDEGYQAFQEKSTPGSWHENGIPKHVFGVDFFLWSYPECYASFDDYDKAKMEEIN